MFSTGSTFVSISRHRWLEFSQKKTASADACIRGGFPRVRIKLEVRRGEGRKSGRSLPRLRVLAVNAGIERSPRFTSLPPYLLAGRGPSLRAGGEELSGICSPHHQQLQTCLLILVQGKS